MHDKTHEDIMKKANAKYGTVGNGGQSLNQEKITALKPQINDLKNLKLFTKLFNKLKQGQKHGQKGQQPNQHQGSTNNNQKQSSNNHRKLEDRSNKHFQQ